MVVCEDVWAHIAAGKRLLIIFVDIKYMQKRVINYITNVAQMKSWNPTHHTSHHTHKSAFFKEQYLCTEKEMLKKNSFLYSEKSLYDGPRCCSLFGTPQNILTAFVLLRVKILIIILTSATVMYDCSTPRATGDSDAHYSATLIKPTHTRRWWQDVISWWDLDRRSWTLGHICTTPCQLISDRFRSCMKKKQINIPLPWLSSHAHTHYAADTDTHRALAH